MPNLDYKDKLLGTINVRNERKIVVTHVTIRQSIFFLLLKLLAIESFAAIVIILFHSLFFSSNLVGKIDILTSFFNIPLFILLVVLKSSFVVFIIVQWLNEYYEITGKEVIYKRGVIIKIEERYMLDHIGSVELNQGFLGSIFNYGTLKIFIWTTEKKVLLYLIHNPKKYQKILEELLPDIEKSKKIVRERILEPTDERP